MRRNPSAGTNSHTRQYKPAASRSAKIQDTHLLKRKKLGSLITAAGPTVLGHILYYNIPLRINMIHANAMSDRDHPSASISCALVKGGKKAQISRIRDPNSPRHRRDPFGGFLPAHELDLSWKEEVSKPRTARAWRLPLQAGHDRCRCH